MVAFSASVEFSSLTFWEISMDFSTEPDWRSTRSIRTLLWSMVSSMPVTGGMGFTAANEPSPSSSRESAGVSARSSLLR